VNNVIACRLAPNDRMMQSDKRVAKKKVEEYAGGTAEAGYGAFVNSEGSQGRSKKTRQRNAPNTQGERHRDRKKKNISRRKQKNESCDQSQTRRYTVGTVCTGNKFWDRKKPTARESRSNPVRKEVGAKGS